jgi:hypothetical protein
MHIPTSESQSDNSQPGSSSDSRKPAIPWYWFRRWFSQPPKPAKKTPRKVDAILLEDRILYSASPLLALLDGTDPNAEQPNSPDALAEIDELMGLLTTPAPNDPTTSTDPINATAPSNAFEQSDLTDLSGPPNQTNPTGRHELVILQDGLHDLDSIVNDLQRDGDDINYSVLVLNRLEDGFDQLDSLLSQYHDLDAIHFVSHGTDGMIQLGNSWLTAWNVDQHQEALQRWGMALGEDGDILIYGCDVAESQIGRDLIDSIAVFTGADVAASIDKTGDLSRGGDWELEYEAASYWSDLTDSTNQDPTNMSDMSNRSDMTHTTYLSSIETRIAFSAGFQADYDSLLATYTVTNTNNSGAGSLRQAIIDANANAGADTIVFSISTGVQTISLSSALPTITGQVTIDGWTQSGFSSSPLIVLDGLSAGSVDGLTFANGSDGSIVRGLVIQRFAGDGIEIQGSADSITVHGNYIGIGSDGVTSRGNTGWGINAYNSASHTIGGSGINQRNIISNNTGGGILVGGGGADNSTIRGNYIGVQSNGTTAAGNAGHGILFSNTPLNNAVGGTGTGEGNVIAHNSGSGVVVYSGSTGIAILGNSIHSNVGIGIDLSASTSATDGVSANDPFPDSDTGGNNRQNFSLITRAVTNASSRFALDGTLTSEANTTYRIEVFANSGQTYLGFTTARTDSSGLAEWGALFNANVAAGNTITTTATKLNSAGVAIETSEFGTSSSSINSVRTVTNTNDTGAGSLRQAITDANGTSGMDLIVFNISGGSTIALSSALPAISDTVAIDGTTQTGWVAGSNIPIIIDGNDLSGTGLTFSNAADGSYVRGLVIRDFNGSAIGIATGSDNHTIVGNFIGSFLSTGLTAGTGEVNTGSGISLAGANTTIGGTVSSDRNVIGGNSTYGVFVNGSGANFNSIAGNYIGVDSTGATILANDEGVHIFDGASSNTVGGSTTAHRNIISGSGNDGVQIWTNANNNVIQNNYIGTDVTGTLDRGNADDGIDIDTTSSGNQFLNNLISGNDGDGIDMVDGGANSTTIQGNLIGTQANGTSSLSNSGNGIQIGGTTNTVLIGGTSNGQGNTIAFNGLDGIAIIGSTTNIAMLGNSVFSNTAQGIDLANDGITYNDISDADTGANGLLNFPILRTATTSGGNTTITGNVRGLASTTFRVEFFSNAYGAADASGYGEGRTYLGSTTVTTNSSGQASFTAVLSGVTLTTGATVTSTATVDLGGGSFGATSEFAGNIIANLSNLMISGTYTGNAVDNRTITGLGFRPELVMVFSESAAVGVMRTATMSGDATKLINGGASLITNVIQSLDGDGFTIGTAGNVNTSAAIYHWIAFGAGDNIDVGAYTGNGTSQSVANVGFQPELVMSFSNNASNVSYRSTLNANTQWMTSTTSITTGITALNTDGFTVSTDASVNANSTAIHYVAFNQNSNYFSLGTYTGNGADNRSITGVGFEPEYVFVKRLDANNTFAAKTESTGYNVDKSIFNNTAQSTNNVQALESDGFQIGTNARVNTTAGTYSYFAFRQKDAPLIVDTTSDTNDGTTTSINALRAARGADNSISLREAIAAVNATRNVNNTADQIQFVIGSGGAQTISITSSDLAPLTEAVVIDASTQSGYTSSPLISLVDGDTRGYGFRLGTGSSGSTIRGFNIQGFGTAGIEIVSASNTIAGNWIGTNAAGTSAAGNLYGIQLNGGDSNIIGGTGTNDRNVISGNTDHGIYSHNSADSNQYLGNTIGLNAAGTSALANGLDGMRLVDSLSAVIGNGTVAGRNVISGNTQRGIFATNADNLTIRGNYIGTSAAGDADVNGTASNNLQSGIVVSTGSTGVVIGGTTAGQGNVISGNNWFGIEITGTGTTGNSVLGNIIGLNAGGTAALGNYSGVSLFSAANNNTIGGSTTAARNIISGNLATGVYIATANITGNKVQGNYIGLAADGTTVFGNAIGVNIADSATANFIGTDNDGTNDSTEGNVISGNTNGIVIEETNTSSNIIAGNFIGTDATGTLDRGNTGDGVRIQNAASSNRIGGTNSVERNIISGNNGNGIQISGSTTASNLVQGNYIGLNVAGSGAIANSTHGVVVNGSATGNTIGGTTAGHRNVIAGNTSYGVYLDAGGNNLYGNYIGTNAAGTSGIANQTGVYINASTAATVGGFAAGQGNLISGNTLYGIFVQTSNHSIFGNTIGLNAAGTSAIANAWDGISFSNNANNTVIGGTTTGHRNVISGNTGAGININGTITGTTVQGNYIGTNSAGTAAFANSRGIMMWNGASSSTIGGTAAGAGNLISGNTNEGIYIANTTSTGNSIQGNWIGVNAAITATIGNGTSGIWIGTNSSSNTIGGSAIGAGNVIGGNTNAGIEIGASSSNVIAGNWIGTNAAGTISLANNNGIVLNNGASSNRIGTNADGSNDTNERNIISGNTMYGVQITGSSTSSNIVAGNYIGTDSTGNAARANGDFGVRIESGATSNTIGGSLVASRNVISANSNGGISIDGEASDGNIIRGNYIGVAANGTAMLTNAGDGINISGGADNTLIGGTGANEGNWIVARSGDGIEITGASSGTVIYGNRIGTDSTGNLDWGTRFAGISLENGVTNTTIGGTSAGQANIIAYSGRDSANANGISVWSTAGTGITIVGNSIYGSRGLEIDLGANGITLNDTLDADTGPNNLQNYPIISSATTNGTQVVVSGSVNSLASVTGLLIHFYATPSTGNLARREGRRYLGSTTVNTDGSGNATFTNVSLASAVTAGETITATATSPGANGNTSEFSQAVVATLTSGNSAPSSSQAVSASDGAISLNNDGGNDQYLQASNGGTIFGGRTQFSIEARFDSTNLFAVGDEMNVLSYATSSSDNEVRLGLRRPTSAYILDFYLNGSSVTATGYDASLLFDGQKHTVSVTWSNTAGAYVFYIDGVSVASGSGLKTGHSIGSSGVLVIGNEQDTLGGSFQANQAFKGKLYDFRIFNDVRTATEVYSGYRANLPYNESGLLANWRMDDLSAAGYTTDAVSGNNLELRRTNSSGYTTSNASLSLGINEGSASGAIVGAIYGTDIDREARISQLLAADSSLWFNAETGKFYKVVSTTTSFATASSTAASTTVNGIGGQLVNIRSGHEQAYLFNLIQSSATLEFYLGATDTTTEGSWKWISGGSEVDQFWSGASTGYRVDNAYTNWHTSEPQGGATENYATIRRTDGIWLDVSGSGGKGYIIEWPFRSTAIRA